MDGLWLKVGLELGLAPGPVVLLGAKFGVVVGRLVLGQEEGMKLKARVEGTAGLKILVGEYIGF